MAVLSLNHRQRVLFDLPDRFDGGPGARPMIAGGARFLAQLAPNVVFQIRLGVGHGVIIVQGCGTPASGIIAL